MTLETILKLNQLNQDFYQLVAQPFSESRNQAWAGWQVLLPALTNKKSLKVLDLGCGNGRFSTFLAEHLPDTNIDYTGVDNNTKLLKVAQTTFDSRLAALHLIKADLVGDLVSNDVPKYFTDKYDLVVAFGLLHHIPSHQLRQQLVNKSLASLRPKGVLVMTAWQFLASHRLQNKVVPPEVGGFKSLDLEANDYFLSWDRGVTAYRYCHLTDEVELKKLFPSDFETFLADGKEGNLNLYISNCSISPPTK